MNKKLFTWGIGIEHEMHLFHIPNNNNISEIIVYDAENAIKRIFNSVKKNKLKLSKSDIEFLDVVPIFTLLSELIISCKLLNLLFSGNIK